jgi:hypothetical protein
MVHYYCWSKNRRQKAKHHVTHAPSSTPPQVAHFSLQLSSQGDIQRQEPQNTFGILPTELRRPFFTTALA